VTTLRHLLSRCVGRVKLPDQSLRTKYSRERIKYMPAPEYRNMPTEEAPEPEEEAHRDIHEDCHASSVDRPTMLESQREESPLEILERFGKQDQELGHDVELLQHLKPFVGGSESHSTELIDRGRLVRIVEDARQKDVPRDLRGYLWELSGAHPDVEEPPMDSGTGNDLSEVLRFFWEKDLRPEIMDELIYLLEGEDSEHKFCEPQPESEIACPENLYQLVRKAWDLNRMEELLAMIEENDDALLGETLEKAIARHRGISL
jgi:hypothetical protein